MKKRKTILKEFAGIGFEVFYPEAEIDYHSLGELTIYEIEKYLIDFLEDCYFANLSRVLVITGKGRVVRPLVQKLLKTNKYVSSFKQAGYFNGQSGAFEVEICG